MRVVLLLNPEAVPTSETAVALRSLAWEGHDIDIEIQPEDAAATEAWLAEHTIPGNIVILEDA